jgi:cytochrome c-type biogenesis protein CcmH/NrfG
MRNRQRQKEDMDEEISRQILAELRKSRMISQWMSVVCLLFLLAYNVLFFLERSKLPQRVTEPRPSWPQVTRAMEALEFDKALKIARDLVARQTNDYYGYSYLGSIYLRIGDISNAETNYARAYGLFPSERIEKDLEAVRKLRHLEGSTNRKLNVN